MKIKSRKQQRLFGFIASGGRPRKGGGPSKAKATRMLKENAGKMRGLPERVGKRGGRRRVSSRGAYGR